MDNNKRELKEKLAKCIIACNYCFNACLGEEDLHMMVQCIKLDKACGEICSTALSLVSSQSVFADDYLELCAKVCEQCAEECGKHQNEHCQDCAKACRECAEACKAAI